MTTLQENRILESDATEDSKVERLELLLSVAQDFTSILDLDRLLRRVGELLQGFVRYKQFYLFLYDEERGELLWKLGIGYSEEPRRRLARFPVTEGLVGRAIRSWPIVPVSPRERGVSLSRTRPPSTSDRLDS